MAKSPHCLCSILCATYFHRWHGSLSPHIFGTPLFKECAYTFIFAFRTTQRAKGKKFCIKPYIKWAVGSEDIAICEEVIARVGLGELRLRPVDALSGGELQKVMLARALVQQPRVLLLDEPTSNLDPKNQYEMMKLVRTVADEKNITVLVVIHDLSLALRFCDSGRRTEC